MLDVGGWISLALFVGAVVGAVVTNRLLRDAINDRARARRILNSYERALALHKVGLVDEALIALQRAELECAMDDICDQ